MYYKKKRCINTLSFTFLCQCPFAVLVRRGMSSLVVTGPPYGHRSPTSIRPSMSQKLSKIGP